MVGHLGGAWDWFAADIGEVGSGDDVEILAIHAEELVGPARLSLYPAGEQPVFEGSTDD